MPKKRVLRQFVNPLHRHERCITQALKAAEAKCALQGLRFTALRRRVLELVWGSHEPVKAYDILDELRGVDKKVAPPTVYRALDFLLETGLIHRIESLNAYVGCGDPARTHHSQFLICRTCGTVAELDDPEIFGLVSVKAKRLGFHIDQETIEVSGLCAQCLGD